MGDLSGYYDENDKPSEFTPLPAGDSPAVLSTCEWKTNKAGTGRYVSCKWEVIDGNFKNRKIFNNLNLDNPNPDAVKFARADLAAIRKATGVVNPNDASELCNIPILLTIGLRKNKDTGENENVIRGYKPLKSGQSVQATANNQSNVPPYMRKVE